MRLNRYLAHCGVCARRKADQHIADGYVSVNGKIETRMGVRISATDKVSYRGDLLELPPHYDYVLLNKPKGCIASRQDPEGRPTIYDLLPASLRMCPSVGRLDRQSTGLIVLTNDGGLAEHLSHPSREVEKIYRVELDHAFSSPHLEQLRTTGVALEDGIICPDQVSIDPKARHCLSIRLHSGKNRVLRRLFAAMGYEVKRLDRLNYGPLTKKGLPRGRWRKLTASEVKLLQA